MTDIEIALTDLGEIATREIAKEHKSYGLDANKKVARDNLEAKLGKLVISNENVLNYKYADNNKLENK